MTWVDARLDFNNIKLDETMKAITIDELHRIWLPIITLSWVTPEFEPTTLQWQNANSGVCQAGNPAQTLMRETNMRNLNRLIETFHQPWSEKMLPALLASLQLSTKDGKAKLELQFGRPGLTTSSKVSLQQALPLSASQSSWAGIERVVKTEEGSFVPGFLCICYSWCCSNINTGSGSKPGSFQSPWKSQ